MSVRLPYPALNSAFDALYPAGQLQHYWKANFAKELTDEAITAHVPARLRGAGRELDDAHLSDQWSRAPRGVGRDGVRVPRCELRDGDRWRVARPRQNEANTKWVRDYYDAIAPYSEEGGYINFMSGDDQGRIKANYKGNYERLVDVKRKYDPDNLFHVNQNIKP